MTTQSFKGEFPKPGPETGKETNWRPCPKPDEIQRLGTALELTAKFRAIREQYNPMAPCILRVLKIQSCHIDDEVDVEAAKTEYHKRRKLASGLLSRIETMIKDGTNEEKAYNRMYAIPNMALLGIIKEASSDKAGQESWQIEVDGQETRTMGWDEMFEEFDDRILPIHMQSMSVKVGLSEVDRIGLAFHLRHQYGIEIPISETP